MTIYTLHIPVTRRYMVDVEADTPQQARAKGAMLLASDGIGDDADVTDEEIQFDIIVVSWTDDEGNFCHTNVGKTAYATEDEAALHALAASSARQTERSMRATDASIRTTEELEQVFVNLCRLIADGNDMRNYAKTVVDHYDSKKRP